MTFDVRPAGSECRQIEALLPPYVDGAAGPLEQAQVAAHLERCASCRVMAESQTAVRMVLRSRRHRLCGTAPAGLTAQLRAAAAGSPVAANPLGRPGRLSALAAAAGLVLATAGGVMWATGRSSVLLAAQLTLDHIKCFMIDGDDHPDHFAPAAAEARMQEAFGWSVPIPAPVSRPDVHLVAVRRCLYGEGMVGHVLYRVGDAPVSMFVMPGRRSEAADLSAFGRHAEVITRGDTTYVLVAPAHLTAVAAAIGLEAE